MPRISRFLLFAATLLFSISVFASSHREAPLITEDPTMDNTDVYAFRSPDAPDTITLIVNFSPLSEASNGPNFYRFNDNGSYEIHIDNTGAAKASITYQFLFRTELRDPMTFGYNSGEP